MGIAAFLPLLIMEMQRRNSSPPPKPYAPPKAKWKPPRVRAYDVPPTWLLEHYQGYEQSSPVDRLTALYREEMKNDTT